VKVLFIGDVVGEPGRRAVRRLLPGLRLRWGVDWVVANGENAAGGAGITGGCASELFDSGVDVLTLGDHAWDNKEGMSVIGTEPRLLRPGNYPAGVPGRGAAVFKKADAPALGVINAQGRTFIAAHDNPFPWALAAAEELRRETRCVFMDFHAEATSEKIAMGWRMDGLVSAVVGTHTHVQTADERILPNGTACLTDVGFTGGHGGILGREWQPIVERFMTGLPQRYPVCDTDVRLQACLVEIDEATGRSRAIERVTELLGN
jgi:2',3'-cyclic-nucleotide 2'-phosphodiesterase